MLSARTNSTVELYKKRQHNVQLYYNYILLFIQSLTLQQCTSVYRFWVIAPDKKEDNEHLCKFVKQLEPNGSFNLKKKKCST